jgi:hypothetical protein
VELGPSAILSTVAATWGDGAWLYCISPYAGIEVSEHCMQYLDSLEKMEAQVCSGEVSEAAFNQTVERVQRFVVDDFMRLTTSMLLNICRMQSLVSHLLLRSAPELLLGCSSFDLVTETANH